MSMTSQYVASLSQRQEYEAKNIMAELRMHNHNITLWEIAHESEEVKRGRLIRRCLAKIKIEQKPLDDDSIRELASLG